MKPDAYARNIAARAFDVARYLLFFGVPTGVGQVVSIRTLERQIRRLKASGYAELREIGDEIAAACAAPAAVGWNDESQPEAIAPTLAKYTDTDTHVRESREDLRAWAAQNLPASRGGSSEMDLLKPQHTAADIVATLLYPVTDRPFRELYETAAEWSHAQRREVIDVALRSRTRRDELLRGFRAMPYVYDIVMDIGAYRDMHRHRRCQQFRQDYSGSLGYAEPEAIGTAGISTAYREAMDAAFRDISALPAPGSQYLLPFGAKARFLFKMDFAEAEYICRLRSGVKGHFSYRKVAWDMKVAMEKLEPELARYLSATPPWIEDPLKR
jgi:hypothetical protein